MDSYSLEDKENIVNCYLLPQLLEKYGFPSNSVHSTKEALYRIVTETRELGMDQVRQNVDACIGYLKMLEESGKKTSGAIDEAFLDECLTPFHYTEHPVYRYNKYQHLYQP